MYTEKLKSVKGRHNEMEHKKVLYFTQGAEEFWLCDAEGVMSFYDDQGQLAHSKLVMDIPLTLELVRN